MKHLYAVTGAFGYSGRYMAERLLSQERQVITLTNSPKRDCGISSRVRCFSFDFDSPDTLTRTLDGVKVLYNTYWVRFNHRRFTHQLAVRNSRILFDAAAKAGVERVVHTSITNPSLDSPLSYFRGKAQVEQALVDSGLSHAILRPAVLFGKEDILINNIAWTLRKLPVFGVFGKGAYSMCPIHVDDMAKLALKQGELRENVIIDAIGPEKYITGNWPRPSGESSESSALLSGCPTCWAG